MMAFALETDLLITHTAKHLKKAFSNHLQQVIDEEGSYIK